MNSPELLRLKMAWLAAKEAGDTQAQLRLLRDHPAEQSELVSFIAAYHATVGTDQEEDATLLPLTLRASQTALERVFAPQEVVGSLAQLRKSRKMSKVETARGLRLSVDVWDKFEAGAIELLSLSERQLERLATFFAVSGAQFSQLLQHSQPSVTLNRRQTRQASRNEQQGLQKQRFADAIARSAMSQEDRQFWLEE